MARRTRTAGPEPKTLPEIEKEILDIEIMIWEQNWRAARRRAWPKEWRQIDEVFPTTLPKTMLSLRLDADMVAWWRKQGRGYQARMNAALRAYMLMKLSGENPTG